MQNLKKIREVFGLRTAEKEALPFAGEDSQDGLMVVANRLSNLNQNPMGPSRLPISMETGRCKPSARHETFDSCLSTDASSLVLQIAGWSVEW
jgi:hypothetical protein